MSKYTDEQLDKIMKIVAAGMSNILGDDVHVGVMKGKRNDIEGKLITTYMRYPIIELKVSRDGCGINAGMCNIEDVVEALPHAIETLLGLVPEEYRDQILEKVDYSNMTENGSILDDEDSEFMEEDDE